jgi:predicted PurR-regulated permease PerM
LPTSSEHSFFPAVSRSDLALWAAAAVVMVLTLALHLLVALFAGLLVYELVRVLAELLRLSSLGGRNAKPVAVALLTTAVVVLLSLGVLGLASLLRHGSDSLPALFQKLADIIDTSRQRLPESLNDYLPEDADDLRTTTVDWLHSHSSQLGGAGVVLGRVLAHALIGMVIGALVALRDAVPHPQRAPLSAALTEHVARLSRAFRRVVFAQAWIATINALITAAYLFVALPLFGAHLPLTKTLLLLTFVAGLVPILGNLVSNSAIVVVSLSVSLPVAVTSLVFLIAVHKLQYFLNARIIGSQIRASAWEILLAMVVMEAAFGIAGVIAAPIFYAYFKDELARKGLV